MNDKFISLLQIDDYHDPITIAVDSIVAIETNRVSDGYNGKKKVTTIYLNNGSAFTVVEDHAKILAIIKHKKESNE